MNGLCIGFDNPNITTIWPESAVAVRANRHVYPIPAGRSRFAHFFEPILPLMRDLSWLAQGWVSSPFVGLIFEPGGEEMLDSHQVDHPRFDGTNAALFRQGTLPALANWLRDDWIDLLGFVPGPAEAGEGRIADELFDAAARGDGEYYEAIERLVALCFSCVDGFSWEVYGQDQAVTAVFEHLAHMEGVEVARGQLRRREDRFG